MDCVNYYQSVYETVPISLILSFCAVTFAGISVLAYTILYLVAPRPIPPTKSEKEYRTVKQDKRTTAAQTLPCWYDTYTNEKAAASSNGKNTGARIPIEDPEVFVSLIVPAYNEEDRLHIMMSEAVDYLQSEYGSRKKSNGYTNGSANGSATKTTAGKANGHGTTNGHVANGSAVQSYAPAETGWEVIVVSDGSTDKTIDTALNYAKALDHPASSCIRVVHLSRNRGKGGAVAHGMRHARGKYAIFADADGASKFSDLGKLVSACQKCEDDQGRGVAIGSRAHLVGSKEVVERHWLRNFLMHCFHLLLKLLTPPRTAAIRDTQCGFKLFSREALPYIIPYMHSEGWIFDVEMLMLAEASEIPVAEVPVGWKEVKGSKLNVIWDSLGMAWSLAVLRAAWMVGVYKRD
ncbi:dolichyl-phosphate beta-glucosyltransferase [Agyrium rufum]|nr:dolichyl-phosphate beta-glucosyltransferase [Agyrium rufum]